MRIVIKTSKLASWSRRLSSIALPALFFSIYLHRDGSLDSETFNLILSLITATAFVAIIFALLAFIVLWFSGDNGWGRAAVGLLLALITIVPFSYSYIERQLYPISYDVSTNPELNIELLSPIKKLKTFKQAEQIELIRAFPNMVMRYYQIDEKDLYQIVKEQIEKKRWDIIGDKQLLGAAQNKSQINATTMSLIGWRDEIAVQISPTVSGSSIAMRSASMVVEHDLGRNGKRIEDFLMLIDQAVTDFSKSNIDFEQVSESH